MKKLLVTACPSIHDVILLEPTLEALYYKHAPCQLVLRTWEGFFPFFEHHPLIHELVGIGTVGDTPPLEGIPVSDIHVDIQDPRNSPLLLPTVEKFAVLANVLLTRKTPWICMPDRPVDVNTIVVTNTSHEVVDWPEGLSDHLASSGATIVTLENPKTIDGTREALRTLASASMVVGPDGWATQAAAALNVRLVIGMTEEGERLRKPFNAVVARPDWNDVFGKASETWFEKRYPDYLNTGNAADFIKCKAKEYMKSRYADVGCSQWPLMNSYPVDKGNRHLIEDAEDNDLAGVFSSHCLEHVPQWDKELTLWHRIIRPGGVLFMYLPHPQCEPWHAKIGSWVGKEHVWNPDPVTLVQFLREKLDFDILEYTSRPDPLWSFYVIARKR
jgi:SAM-dependent methyltransferase